ncbi:putative DNA binding domain-containing protein, partial [Acinetobacter baumannii]|nr:putative DNA binding domain-containing protein [Acinetobacter baumannii]
MYNLKSINLITETQAIELANRTEDNFFDLKSSRSKPSVIEEVAVAFANSEGGEIIIGIEDEKHGQSP